MVQRAPLFDTLSATLSELLSGCLFIAHNVFFDYRFLQYEFARLGLSFTAPLLCSVRLSRLLYPDYRHHNLGVLIDRFQLGATQRHRALDDAEAVWQFLLRARCDKGHEAMDSAIHALVRRPDTAGDALAALVLADAPVAGAAT
jgi:DNA polymerase-3 subunit epsilon